MGESITPIQLAPVAQPHEMQILPCLRANVSWQGGKGGGGFKSLPVLFNAWTPIWEVEMVGAPHPSPGPFPPPIQ